MDVMPWVSLQHAGRASTLPRACKPALAKVMEELHNLREKLRTSEMTNRMAEEIHYRSRLSSRIQRDQSDQRA